MFSSTSSTAAASTLSAAALKPRGAISTLVVIDAGVAGYQQLMAGVVADAAVMLLDDAQDGVAQITSALQASPSINRLHIVAHGSPGTLYLGQGELSLSNLSEHREALASWFSASEAELLLYGCNVAAGDAGEEFIAKLQEITQASIAASTTPIGSSSQGGNWSLDATTGVAMPKLAFTSEAQAAYVGILDWFEAEQLLADATLNNVPGNVDPSSISQGDIDQGDQFGSSVAIFDGYAIVGVPNNADVIDPNTGAITLGQNVGSVYVFTVDPDDGSWARETELTSDEPIFNESFGVSVDASQIPGSDDLYVAVGASGARSPSPTTPGIDEFTGAAYVFKRDAATGAWSLVQKVVHTDNGPANGTLSSRAFDQFGSSVGLDGSTLVVGAPNDSRSLTEQQTGAVYLFEASADGSAWTQVGNKIANPNNGAEAAFDRFGSSVAIADGLIIAGSPNAEVPNAQGVGGVATAGTAYIYRQQPDGSWDVNNSQAVIASDGKSVSGQQQGVANDQFGFSVDIVNGYAIVGAPGNDIVEAQAGGGNQTFLDAGSAYVFQDQGGTWVQVQQLTGNDGKLRSNDQFGVSVGIDDGAIVVGALREEVDGFDDPTFVNEISPDENDPNQIARLPAPGVAYIYELNDAGTAWEQEDRVTGSDKINGDQFGAAVDVYTSSAGGSTAVVGASTKNYIRGNIDATVGGQFGINADLTQAGAAYIYRSQPQVSAVTPNVTYINDPLIAGTNPETPENYFTLTIEYDQPMNTGIAPDITFPNPFENPGSTTGLTPDFFAWTNSRTFVARYDLVDINVEQVNIDISVDGGVGISGAPQVPALPPNALVTDVFSIDTKNPTANFFNGYFDGLGLTQPVPSAVNQSFTFVASFDETVASPAFDFVNANIADFTFDGGTGTFTVIPINEGVVSVNLAADSTLDLRSNLSNRPPVFSTIYDITPPEVSLAIVGYDPALPINQPFTMRALFSEAVENFDVGDISITNGVIDAASFQVVSANEYLFNVDPRVNGEVEVPVTLSVAAGVANDIATNLNNASAPFSIVYDGARPDVILSTVSGSTVEGPFQIIVNFSEIVSGFDAADILVTNGNITSVFSTSGVPVSSEFTVDITPIQAGPVSISVIENGAGDGVGNLNTPSNTLAFDYVPPVPVVTQIVPSIPIISDNVTTFSLSISYSSTMDQTINPDITFPNPTENAIGTITPTTGSWVNATTFVQNYSVTDLNLDIADIDVASANAQDVDGNIQEAANSVVSNVFSIEMLSPTVSLTADSGTGIVTAIFSEPVSDFDLNDITVGFGTASNVQQQSPTTYTFSVVTNDPVAAIPIEVTIAAGAAIDLSGNPSEVSDQLIIDNINDAPVITPPAAGQNVDGDKVLRFSTANGNAIQIADVDAGGAPLEVTLTATQGLVTLTNTSGLTFTNGDDGFADDVLTFQGSLSDVNAALEELRFKPVNITGNASLTIEVDDLGNTGLGGAQTAAPQTIDIAVTKVAENDFNGDGFSDILLRNSFSGDNLVRFMNGTTVLGDGNLGRPIPDVNWRFERTGDFNGDGKADIILRNYNGSGQNLIWYMDGSTILGEELAGRLVPDPAWEIEGTGDFNNDGQTDIILKNYNSDQNLIWYMNGSQIIQEGLFGRDLGDLTWRIQGTADFNGDGQTDILLRHLNPAGLGQNLVWFMNGPDIIGEALIGREVPDVNWEIAGAADFNGDGQSDILLRNYASGENLLWEMNGTSILRETLILAVPDTNWRATV